jgi:6-phosphogluconolactonase (cycloisomerase 2 family)
MTLSPNGEFLFVDDLGSGKIKMLRVADGTLVQEIGVNSRDEVSSMCVSPDGGELFVAYQTGRIKVFKL